MNCKYFAKLNKVTNPFYKEVGAGVFHFLGVVITVIVILTFIVSFVIRMLVMAIDHRFVTIVTNLSLSPLHFLPHSITIIAKHFNNVTLQFWLDAFFTHYKFHCNFQGYHLHPYQYYYHEYYYYCDLLVNFHLC